MYQKRDNTNAVVRLSDNAIVGPESEEDWRAYQEWLADGNEAEPFIEPPPAVPASVPLWAVRVILAERGLLKAANAAITAMDNRALQVIWEYGNTVDRSSPALLALAEALGVADELDALFIEAAELKI
jgi:hypothetical protein